MLYVDMLSEKKSCVGRPVVMVKVLDWLLILVLLASVATTQTGVGTVPAISETLTYPLESVMPELADKYRPPGLVSGMTLKFTVCPFTPVLVLSTTLNLTMELVCSDEELAVEVPIVEGVADTNWILVAIGAATVIFALLVLVAPVTDAVIVSIALQPLSV